MKGQLAHCQQQANKNKLGTSCVPVQPVRNAIDSRPLPRNWVEMDAAVDRAIVVTETHAPFRIVSVNGAWERLCGYTLHQARHQTLGRLLHGPDTDAAIGTGLIAQLLQSAPGDEATVTLTNYTASGDRFRNRVRAGIMEAENAMGQSERYFVGVLQRVQDGM